MAGLLLAGVLFVVCVLGAGGAFKAHAAEYDYATRTLKLTEAEAKLCAQGGGCLPMTRDFVEGSRHLALQSSKVIERLELEIVNMKRAAKVCK